MSLVEKYIGSPKIEHQAYSGGALHVKPFGKSLVTVKAV